MGWPKGVKQNPESNLKRSKSLKDRKFSEEHLRKLSETKRGELNPNKSGEKNSFFGRHHSKETKQKLSIANTGRPSPTKGKKRPEFSGSKNLNWKEEKHIIKYCECGCNKLANPGNKFIIGHNNRGENHPMKRPEISAKLSGENSSTKRPEVRAKMSEKAKGENNSMFGKTGEKSPVWQGGKSFEPYGLAFNGVLRDQIRKRDNYQCQECGYSQNKLGYKLHVHHIDYDKQNNDPLNFISLCRSCHTKTNYDREDWTNYYKHKIIEN